MKYYVDNWMEINYIDCAIWKIYFIIIFFNINYLQIKKIIFIKNFQQINFSAWVKIFLENIYIRFLWIFWFINWKNGNINCQEHLFEIFLIQSLKCLSLDAWPTSWPYQGHCNLMYYGMIDWSVISTVEHRFLKRGSYIHLERLRRLRMT